MNWQLSPGVSFCRTGEEIVFLDLRTDRYFQLSTRDQQIFERLQRREAADTELERFLAADILRPTAENLNIQPVEVALAADDIYILESAKSSIFGAVEVGFHVARARRAVRSLRLAATIADLSRRKIHTENQPDETILAAALRFDSNRSLVPIARRCLIDSVALLRMLLGHGQAAELIFGVRTRPFAAHCWLQAEGHILTCTHDEARNFTPILVI